MAILGIFEFTLFFICPPMVIDSSIYRVDVDKVEVHELTLNESVIDYAFDDFIYILTSHYLYKIDWQNFFINDRTSLPQRFNYLAMDGKDIMLITTNEIVIMDKNNLAFKRGIGIETGDYQPIVSSDGMILSTGGHSIFLIADEGTKSIIKIFDLDSGRHIKKIRVNKLTSFECDSQDKTLTTLDIDNKLIIYDIKLNRKRVIDLKFECLSFKKCRNNYIIFNPKGIFIIDNKGGLIDFQPISVSREIYSSEYLFLVDDGLILIDTLTLMIRQFSPNTEGIVRLFESDHLNNYAFAIDGENNFYSIDIDSLKIEPMVKKRAQFKKIVPMTTKTDSSWYLQLGAFTSFENAMKMYNHISQSGIPIIIDSTDFYRIKFGGFYDKITAMELVEKIDLAGWLVFQKKIEQKDIIEFYAGSERYILKDGIIRKE